mgnify:CR=1 FL=1
MSFGNRKNKRGRNFRRAQRGGSNRPRGGGNSINGKPCSCGTQSTRSNGVDYCCVGAPKPPQQMQVLARGGNVSGRNGNLVGGCTWRPCGGGLTPSAEGWANQNPQQQLRPNLPGCCSMQTENNCNENADGCIWSWNWADAFMPYGSPDHPVDFDPSVSQHAGTCFPSNKFEECNACPYPQWPVGEGPTWCGQDQSDCVCHCGGAANYCELLNIPFSGGSTGTEVGCISICTTICNMAYGNSPNPDPACAPESAPYPYCTGGTYYSWMGNQQSLAPCWQSALEWGMSVCGGSIPGNCSSSDWELINSLHLDCCF